MVKVYLDREALLDAGATSTGVWRGSAAEGRLVQVLTYTNIRLDVGSDGKALIELEDLLADVPKNFEIFVSEVSYYCSFGSGIVVNRRLGHYCLRSAVAELELAGSGHNIYYHLKIRAKNLSNLRELHWLIRDGLIWPAIDYEREQVPPPFRHLRDLLSEMWQLIRRDVSDRLFQIRERVR